MAITATDSINSRTPQRAISLRLPIHPTVSGTMTLRRVSGQWSVVSGQWSIWN